MKGIENQVTLRKRLNVRWYDIYKDKIYMALYLKVVDWIRNSVSRW